MVTLEVLFLSTLGFSLLTLRAALSLTGGGGIGAVHLRHGKKDLTTVHTVHVATSKSTVRVHPYVDDVRDGRAELRVVAPSDAGFESDL